MSESNKRQKAFESVKDVIRENYGVADCGLFFTRNFLGDPMFTLYEDEENGITVDLCYHYSYFEVFGLSKDEEKELERFYEQLDEKCEVENDAEILPS